MVVAWLFFGKALKTQRKVQRGAIGQLVGFLAVQRPPGRLARGNGRGGQVTLAARDLLGGDQRVAAPGVQVDAEARRDICTLKDDIFDFGSCFA